jgi:hypothetical protein
MHQIQDVILPYILDDRLPEDTLFLVAEADWRCCEEDCLWEDDFWWEQCQREDLRLRLTARAERACQAAERFKGTGGDAPWPSPSPAGASPGETSSSPRDPTAASSSAPPPADTQPPRRDEGSPGEDPQRVRLSPSPAAVAEHAKEVFCRVRGETFAGWKKSCPRAKPSGTLVDLVRICTAAARCDHGDFVWLSWNGRRDRKRQPSYGSTLLAVTKRFARVLKAHLERVPPDDFDIILACWLREENMADQLRACFTFPSIGAYKTHESGCDPHAGPDGQRRAVWSENYYSKGGTRDARGITLGTFVQKGNPPQLQGGRAIPLDSPQLRWFTQEPPRCWWEEQLLAMCQNREWVSPDGQRWLGPPYTEAEWVQWRKAQEVGRGQGWPSPSPAAQAPGHASNRGLQQLRDDPNGCPPRTDGRGSHRFTRVAMQFLVDPPSWLSRALPPQNSTREARQRRLALAAYEMRVFTSDPEHVLSRRRKKKKKKSRGERQGGRPDISGRQAPGRPSLSPAIPGSDASGRPVDMPSQGFGETRPGMPGQPAHGRCRPGERGMGGGQAGRAAVRGRCAMVAPAAHDAADGTGRPKRARARHAHGVQRGHVERLAQREMVHGDRIQLGLRRLSAWPSPSPAGRLRRYHCRRRAKQPCESAGQANGRASRSSVPRRRRPGKPLARARCHQGRALVPARCMLAPDPCGGGLMAPEPSGHGSTPGPWDQTFKGAGHCRTSQSREPDVGLAGGMGVGRSRTAARRHGRGFICPFPVGSIRCLNSWALSVQGTGLAPGFWQSGILKRGARAGAHVSQADHDHRSHCGRALRRRKLLPTSLSSQCQSDPPAPPRRISFIRRAPRRRAGERAGPRSERMRQRGFGA